MPALRGAARGGQQRVGGGRVWALIVVVLGLGAQAPAVTQVGKYWTREACERSGAEIQWHPEVGEKFTWTCVRGYR